MTKTQEPSVLGRIVEIVRDLRKRCSWDKVQSRATLRPYLVEEVMELDHAIAQDDPEEIKKELGDVMLHVAFQIVIAEELEEFGAEDVANTIIAKMKRRHPHLYGGGEKAATWEKQKIKEQTTDDWSVLDGLPPTMPALLMAYRLQERAAGMGFDWPDANGPREKVTEELAELDAEIGGDAERIESELGDLLFSVVNLARKLGHDPRTAMEKANRRFQDRFRQVERLCRERGVELDGASLEQLDELWEEAKVDRWIGG